MFDIYTSHLPVVSSQCLVHVGDDERPEGCQVCRVVEYSFRIIASQPEADEIFHVVLLRLELKRVFVAAGFVVEIRINLRHDFEFAAFVGDV